MLKFRRLPFSLKKSGATTSDFDYRAYFASSVPEAKSASSIVASVDRSLVFRQDDDIVRWVKLELSDRVRVDSVISRLKGFPNVEYVGRNRAFHIEFVPNDPFIDQQWGLEKIQAFDAWDIERGRPDVLVAIIDTGIDYLHHDLRDNLWVNPGEDINGNGVADDGDINGLDDDNNGFIDDIRGWDFTDAPNYPDGGDYLTRDNDPMDESGHGTGVAGVIAAVTDNGAGIAGVAHRARLMNVRAFTAGGNGEEDDVASAILYAIANGARIINMSWGDVFVTRLLDDVIRYAEAHGIVMVASAGNASTDQIHYPSGFSGTISVGATDKKDDLAGFSNFGPTIDLVAPGVDIYTTTLADKYTTYSGTSFSAPYVSGVAALLLSRKPDLSAEGVKSLLTRSADDLGNTGWDRFFGAGRLNAYRALTEPLSSMAKITSPRLDQGFSAAPIVVRGSAWSPNFSDYYLSYGRGDNPEKWIDICAPKFTRIIDGVLTEWRDIPHEDGAYTLRLTVENRDGKEDRDYVRIFIDRTAPVITDVELLPMVDRDRYSVLVQFKTDDLCEGSIFYRPEGSGEPFQEAAVAYRTHELRLNMTPDLIGTKAELKLRAVNGAGLETVDDNAGQLYRIDLSKPPIDIVRFVETGYQMPFGSLLNRGFDFNGDNRQEVILGKKSNNAIDSIHFYEFDGTGMADVFALPEPLIPRDVGDSDGDGKSELLCGLGFSSYLYESPNTGAFPSQRVVSWQGDGTTQYWASRIADVDGDGIGEIIFRIVGQDGGKPYDQFQVWESIGDNAYLPVAKLVNPTDGSNGNGVPHCEIGDFDNDGHNEILLGDSDGDVYIYESVGDNSFRVTWQDSLPLEDSIDYLSSGDYDGDGQIEFIAGCHSNPNLNTEHDYDARHWYFRLYDRFADNDYRQVAEWRFFGFESPKDFASGISSGDVNGDGDDEILLCVYPDFYIIDYTADEKYEITYYHEMVESGGAAVLDVDGDGQNEFWIGTTNQRTLALARASTSNAMPAPVDVNAQPLDEKTVHLVWRPVSTADYYIVYRGLEQTGLDSLDVTGKADYLDTTVVASQLYWYAVAAVGGGVESIRSLKSGLVSAQPGPRPALQKAALETPESVRLWFSHCMDGSAGVASNYIIDNGAGRPTSAAIHASGQQVVLTLARPFIQEGIFTVTCQNLKDANGVPMDTLHNSTQFPVQLQPAAPYLVNGKLVDHELELIFSEPMEKTSIENPANYILNENIQVTSALRNEEDRSHVVLQLAAHVPFGALGKSYTVKVQNVYSEQGVPIRAGRGDLLQLIFSKRTLDHVFTYPNPFRSDLGIDHITFANLTKTAEIQIMTVEGKKIKRLYEKNGDGGIEWDLRDEQGQKVASGIYLYRVVSKNQSKIGKFAIVR